MNTLSNRSSHRTVRTAFTLIEVIVVVTIIALLAAIVAPRFLGQTTSAKIKAAKAEASSVAKAVQMYLTDIGKSQVPDDFDLEMLLLPPDEGGGPTGPYLDSDDALNDPWGNRYQIIVPGEVHYDFDIMSYGEDGEQGGEGADEDITH